jgi:3'(2'), 5'-bisphosphate nucleotidase
MRNDGDLESFWARLDDRLLPMLQGYRQRLPTLDVAEKADRTLLTEADIATQGVIVKTILEIFPDSGFIAEEDDTRLPRTGSPVWVIDPIDGTSEFVNPSAREFCSVVCRLDSGTPTGAYVLAPELGAVGNPIRIHWTERVTVNGHTAPPLPERDVPIRASVTRSKGSAPASYESELARVGCEMKLRTTSQTLDMVRSAIDLSTWTHAPDKQFDVFYRRSQKVWDGTAGIALAAAMGRIARNEHGKDPIPIAGEILADTEPTFGATVAGDPNCVTWFLSLLRTEVSGGG